MLEIHITQEGLASIWAAAQSLADRKQETEHMTRLLKCSLSLCSDGLCIVHSPTAHIKSFLEQYCSSRQYKCYQLKSSGELVDGR